MNKKIINLTASIRNEQKIISVSKSVIDKKKDELKKTICKTIISLWEKHFGENPDIHYEDSLFSLEETLGRNLDFGCYDEEKWPYEIYIYLHFSKDHKHYDKELNIYNNKWYYNYTMDDYEEKIKEIGEDNFWNNFHDEFKEIELNITIDQFNKFLKDLNKKTGFLFTYPSTMQCLMEKLDGEIIE